MVKSWMDHKLHEIMAEFRQNKIIVILNFLNNNLWQNKIIVILTYMVD
jgi:hypothetical protein